MTWYAIRTAPGAQMPQREYVVEPTALGADGRSRGKGYRIVPSLDPDVSAIERSLSNARFIHYMPVEKRLVRDRKKTDLWKPRRFALLLGYVFVQDVERWADLEETPGVASVVRSMGKPMPIRVDDILLLRTMEAEADQQFERMVEERAAKDRQLTRKRAAKVFPAGSLVEIMKGHGEGRYATTLGPGRKGQLRVLLASLEAEVSVPMDAVQLVADAA
jgi:transcription antitermination factor NusG